jgi:hypothetical protein
MGCGVVLGDRPAAHPAGLPFWSIARPPRDPLPGRKHDSPGRPGNGPCKLALVDGSLAGPLPSTRRYPDAFPARLALLFAPCSACSPSWAGCPCFRPWRGRRATRRCSARWTPGTSGPSAAPRASGALPWPTRPAGSSGAWRRTSPSSRPRRSSSSPLALPGANWAAMRGSPPASSAPGRWIRSPASGWAPGRWS